MNILSYEEHLTLHDLIRCVDPNQYQWSKFFRDKNGLIGVTCNFCNVNEMSSNYENNNLSKWIYDHGIKHLKLKAFI